MASRTSRCAWNASLAGLVAVTAGCDVTDALGSAIIGAVGGLLVVFGVWLLDYKRHVDDPVGAVAVHCLNGIWGTLAVGLFATSSAPGYSIASASGEQLVRTLLRRRTEAAWPADYWYPFRLLPGPRLRSQSHS